MKSFILNEKVFFASVNIAKCKNLNNVLTRPRNVYMYKVHTEHWRNLYEPIRKKIKCVLLFVVVY